jgi:hypothetical protein
MLRFAMTVGRISSTSYLILHKNAVLVASLGGGVDKSNLGQASSSQTLQNDRNKKDKFAYKVEDMP